MLAITFTAVLAVIGVAADASGQFRSLKFADAVAAETARTAGQAVDLDHSAATGQHRVDPQAAEQAAHTYLTQAGVEGQIAFSDDLTEVTVTVQHVYEPRVLNLFGWPPTTVTGSHTATLEAG